MGIQGLLSFLEKASRPANISEFSGRTVAIDSYCWLHKGAFSCAEKLARGEPTDQYVNYCMKFVNMLLSYNIKPIMVFDGRHLPAKAETEKKRRELREANRKRAAELLRLERDSEARSLIQRCVDVTHEMALALMKRCRSQGVDCIVAPYEADAQLAYLNLKGIAHVIITEDSDLMLFGCKLVLFKMDVYGNGMLVEQYKIPLSMKQHPNQFTMDKFRYMCILSGCDYLKSLPGIGLAKACKFIKKTQDNNISRALTRLGAYLNMPNLQVTQDYRDKFIEADGMFKYQPVFDPITRTVVPLNPLPPDVSSPLINLLDKEVSYQLALGNLNPFTLETVDNWDPDQPQTIKTNGWKTNIQKQNKSIWSKDYKIPPPLPPPRDPKDVKHPTTKGKTITQSVTALTEKIAVLPKKQNIEEELSKLRESYSIKPSLTTQKLSEDTIIDENEIYSSDSGITIESDEKQSSEESNTPLTEFNMSPKEYLDDNFEFTLDDIFSEKTSPVIKSKTARNPFSSAGTKNSARRSLGGALDMFSNLKKSHVEAACVVQSRYFASNTKVSSSNCKKDVQKQQVTPKKDHLEDALTDIINATPSPEEKRRSLVLTKSPKKNTFIITDIEESCKDQSSPKGIPTESPRKNIFSVSTIPNDDKLEILGSPEDNNKETSFLKILNNVSKEDIVESKTDKPVKKNLGSLFKWNQPLLKESPHTAFQAPSSLLGLYKPTSKQKAPCFSPKTPPKRKISFSPKGKYMKLPENATFKKTPTQNKRQGSLLSAFSFEKKPKLTTP